MNQLENGNSIMAFIEMDFQLMKHKSMEGNVDELARMEI